MKRSSLSMAAAGLAGVGLSLLAATTATAAPLTATASAAASSSSAHHVTIPSNYSYHPHRGPHIPWHDYCTKSPDEFPTFGTNANFRGPCARHDMCYEFKQHAKSTCDLNFYNNLKSECNWTYKHWYDPRKSACLGTAWVYYKAVQWF